MRRFILGEAWNTKVQDYAAPPFEDYHGEVSQHQYCSGGFRVALRRAR